MKFILTLSQLILFSVVFSQSTITVFNNGGQQFYVILNGIKQNSVPQTNVAVSGITNGSYSMKLIFSDGKTMDIDKNFFIEEPSYITTRVVFKKGKGKLQLIGMEPASGQQNENDVVYRPNNSAIYSDAVVTTTETITTNSSVTQSGQNNSNENAQVNQSTAIGNGNSSENVNFNMNVNASGQNTENSASETVNMSVNINGSENGENMGMNVSINVTENGTQNGSENIDMNVNMSGTGMQNQQTTQTTQTTVTQTNVVSSNGQGQLVKPNSNQTNNSVLTCSDILGDSKSYLVDLNEFTFDEDKKELVIKDFKEKCLTASQAYEIIEVFTFEADRLELSKYMHHRIIDKENSKNLMKLFTFDSSKLEFREYINSNK